MRDHRKLKAFELADELVILSYKVTEGFPKEELYGLTSQIKRSAISVPSNIVEGCARDTQADYVRFLYMAFGSLRELHYQLQIAERLNFMSSNALSVIEEKVIETEKVLSGLIKAFKKE
ncbi:MAG TPA: four helix bundle protein [Deltaproteobacteria bacterium]|nr:four helix bundle protein [Deltaproteobacteria bacterium]